MRGWRGICWLTTFLLVCGVRQLAEGSHASSRDTLAGGEGGRAASLELERPRSATVRVELGPEEEGPPVTSEPRSGAPGEPEVVELSQELFTGRVHLILFSPELSSRLPFLIHRAARGDYLPFARIAAAFGRAIRDQIYFGMQLAVVCAEDLPRITDADVARETPGTFLGRARIDRYRSLCAEMPAANLPGEYWETVQAKTPALLISGALDPATPPRFGEAVAKGLPNARHLVLEEATHMVRHPCLERIVADFFAAGTAEGLDTSCAREIRRPPFFVDLVEVPLSPAHRRGSSPGDPIVGPGRISNVRAPSSKPPVEPETIPGEYDQLVASEWGLDWGDVSQIRAKLELTPTQRLQAAQELMNAVIRIRAQNAGRG